MPNATEFGRVLSRLRRERGFESAHAFYRARDGRRWMGLSFASYLALEKGRSLPKPERLKRLIELLGVAPGSAPAKDLARAYLTGLAGSEPLELAGFGESGDGGGAKEGLAELAARQAMSVRAAQLDLAQWKALATDFTTYSCHAFLINTPGWTKAADLPKGIRQDAASVKKALKTLAAAGLVEQEGGRVRSKFAGKVVAALPSVTEAIPIKSAIHAHRRKWTEGPGAKLEHAMQITVRIPHSRLKTYTRHIDEAIGFGAVYGDVEGGPDTSVYFVDARVFEIFG